MGSGHKGCACASQTSLRAALRRSLQGQHSALVALEAMQAGRADPSFRAPGRLWLSHTKACGAGMLSVTPAWSPE